MDDAIEEREKEGGREIEMSWYFKEQELELRFFETQRERNRWKK